MKKIVFLLLFLLSINVVCAVNIGVSPASLNFGEMLRLGYAERTVTVSITTERSALVSLSPGGEIKDWITLPDKRVNSSLNAPGRFKVIINVPSNAPNGQYTGNVHLMISGFSELNLSRLEGDVAVGSRTLSSVILLIKVEVSDREIIECSARDFSVASVEKGDDIDFSLKIKNNGNIILTPEIAIDVWDVSQEKVVKIFTYETEEILPTVEKNVTAYMSGDDLTFGQYWAQFSVLECDDKSNLLTFDVMEEGILTTSGRLLKIQNKVWVDLEEIVPITAVFENTGEKSVIAKFVGEILLNGKTVDVLESDELTVLVDEIVNITVFYTPVKAGRHLVKGRVFYEKKRTYELESVIQVNPSLKEKFNFWGLTYVLIAAVILFLLYKIKKEKKKF